MVADLHRPAPARPAIEEILHEQINEMLGFFEFQHLPQQLQSHSRPFHALAHDLVSMTMWSFELVATLRALLIAKDGAVRALKYELDQRAAAARSRAGAAEASNDG